VKLLANENFPKASVLLLRELDYNIISIGEDNRSISDEAVMTLAIKEQRLILTFDRDYGELIFKFNYKPEQGVLFLRLTDYSPEYPGRVVHELLSINKLETAQRLTVYDGNTIRQRKY
jgi:predicted nuclease of predicted toxin-antitoxin system